MYMAIPKDKKLYDKVKKEIYQQYPKHSAYRSGQIVKKYKEEYFKKYGSKDAYEGKKKVNKGLDNWFKSEWRNQRGEIGYKYKGDIYRPTKRINKYTPKTFDELSSDDIADAMLKKLLFGRASF